MEKRDKRINQLLVLLKANNVSSIKDMASFLNVSTMTVRRDLEILAEQGLVKFIHGGAIYVNNNHVDGTKTDYHISNQYYYKSDEKIRIGIKAASFIQPDDVIMVDSGTTTQYLVQAIPEDLRFTAICWSLNIIEEFVRFPNCTLIACGGIYHSEAQTFEGETAINLIRNMRTSMIFLSAGGLNSELGITCPLAYEGAVKKAGIESSLKKILLIDSSKFGKVCMTYLTGLDAIDMIITDNGIPGEYIDYIHGAGKELIIV